MSGHTTIHLDPLPIDLDSPEFVEICGWDYEDAFVGRLLREDIPQRIAFSQGQIWVYKDTSGQLAGFGTLDFCKEYENYSDGRLHSYIPLLAKNPAIRTPGYGTSIIWHLINEAALLVNLLGCDDVLYLDAYEHSIAAMKLYEKVGFARLIDEPIPDSLENGRRYYIMAKRVAMARGSI